MSYSHSIGKRRNPRRRLRANTVTGQPVAARQKSYPNTIRNLLESRVHRAYTVTMDELFLRGYLSRDERLEIAGRIGEFLGQLGEVVDEDGTGQRAVDAYDVDFIAGQKEAREETAVTPQSSFVAYKGADGRYHWIGVSTNSYQDRDGEWVTQKAQGADVDRMNATGQYGTLDWWHTRLKAADGREIPLNIGDCTHATMIGRFRLESGTFYDDVVGEAFATSKTAYKMSLEFLYPHGEPARGQYHHVFTIRRSVLPADAASNSLTGFVTGQKAARTPLKEQEMSKKTYERLKAMAAESGVDAVLQAIAGVSELDATAKGLKLAAKSKKSDDFGALADLSDADLEALVSDITALKEQRAREPEVVELDATAEIDMDAFAEAITKAVRAGMQEPVDQLTALFTNRTKEQVETDRKAGELQTQIKQLNDQLAELKAGPKATKEAQANGFRPTRHNPGQITQPAATAEQGQDGFEMIAQKATNL